MARATSNIISRQELDHVAELAHLELANEEKALFTEQLNTILEYFHILDRANTKNVPPTLNVLGLENVWRPDKPESCMSIEKVLLNVPNIEKGFVKAPKIV